MAVRRSDPGADEYYVRHSRYAQPLPGDPAAWSWKPPESSRHWWTGHRFPAEPIPDAYLTESPAPHHPADPHRFQSGNSLYRCHGL